MDKTSIKTIAENRKARHDYFILESYEAGIELTGTEVKSIRDGGLNLKDSWIAIEEGEAFIKQMHISPYEKGNIFKSFGTFIKNRPAVGCTIAAMGMFLGMQSASTANTIMFATHFGNASMSGLVTMIGFLPMFIFMPFATKLVKKYGKKEVAAIGSIAGLIGAAVLLVFPLCPRQIQLLVYMAGLIFFGLGMGFYNCVSWAMMGDAIDYQEWKTGKREESVVYSLHSFFRKLAQGVGPAAVIAIMGTSLIGYDEKLGTIGQSAQTASNMCWLVAILYTISAVSQFVGVALVYNINKKTLAQMHEDLKAKHEA